MKRPERDEDQPSPASAKKGKDAAGLRVALFSGNYNYIRDGANNALNHLGRFLLDRGAAVRVYSPTLPHPAFAPAGDVVSIPSIPIPGRGEYRLGLGLGRHAREDIRRFAPTVFHLSAPDRLGHRAQAFARDLGVPVVASLHTRFESYLGYYGLGFARSLVERVERRFYRGCDLVLVPNLAMAEVLARWGLSGKVRLWSRGVDHAQFAPEHRSLPWRRAHGYTDDEIVLLFFGRLVREKGLDVFADVVGALRARGHRIRPLVVGTGPERGHLSQRLGKAVFTGHLEGARLARAIASADIMLNPSVTEAFGNVDLEAMASGLALVSTDVPYALTLLDERSGALVPPGDPAGYVAAVERLILHPAERAALAEAALHRSTAFGWPQTLAAVLSAYRELGAVPGVPGRPRAAARSEAA